jgi:hypothetical protein
MSTIIHAAFRSITLILSLARRRPYRAALIFAVCASLCGVVTARDLARSKAKWLAYQAQLIADNPIPADLAPILPSDIPRDAGSLYGLANWPLDPPLPAGC